VVLFAKVVLSTLALLPFYVFIEKRLGQHWSTGYYCINLLDLIPPMDKEKLYLHRRYEGKT